MTYVEMNAININRQPNQIGDQIGDVNGRHARYIGDTASVWYWTLKRGDKAILSSTLSKKDLHNLIGIALRDNHITTHREYIGICNVGCGYYYECYIGQAGK
jgi:hypothetical protein